MGIRTSNDLYHVEERSRQIDVHLECIEARLEKACTS